MLCGLPLPPLPSPLPSPSPSLPPPFPLSPPSPPSTSSPSSCTQLTLGRGGINQTFFGNLQEMDDKQLKMNLTVPRTQMIGDGASQVQDVTNVQLPGFLLLDYTTDVRPDARLSSTGSAGAIFRALLLEEEAIQRNGSEIIAMKEVVEWPSLSDEDNRDRFFQELAMMWALSFHPNVAKLVGYTETPRTIITKLYPTDLFRYLHMQDDKEQLESHLLLHLTSGIVAGLAAIHSLKIAHRDVTSPNILLAEPRASGVFPDPIIADFGIARAVEDNTRFESINGYSPRYASPEVIARVHIKVRAEDEQGGWCRAVQSLTLGRPKQTRAVLSRRPRRPWKKTRCRTCTRSVCCSGKLCRAAYVCHHFVGWVGLGGWGVGGWREHLDRAGTEDSRARAHTHRFRGTATPTRTLRCTCGTASVSSIWYVPVATHRRSPVDCGSSRTHCAVAPWSSSSNPSQDVDGQDAIVAHVNEVIVSLIQPAVERRPSAMATNRKFARFIRALLEPEDDDI